MPRTVDFYFDYISPASYFAWTQLPKLCAEHGATLRCKPFVLGAVFKATNNPAPGLNPIRAKYLMMDLARWSKLWGERFQLNPAFPMNTTPHTKGAMAVQIDAPEQEHAYHEALFRAMWGDARDIGDPDVLAEVLGEAGIDAGAVNAATERDDVKAALRANTDEAIARGAFGAPTVFVDDEMFFGQDRIFMIEAALKA